MSQSRSPSKFEAARAFLRRRFSPEGYLGLHLTVGLVVLATACLIFAHITEDVVTHAPLIQTDTEVANFFHANATPARNDVMFAISFLGSGRFLGIVTTLWVAYLAWQRSWYRLLTVLLVVPGGSLINVALKHLFRRDRPLFENPITTLDSYSFPSGHAMGSTLFYGLMAVFAVQHFQSRKPREIATAGAVSIVLMIGFTRISLGVHYLSDVLGAMAAGVAWLALCVTGVETFRRRREHLGN